MNTYDNLREETRTFKIMEFGAVPVGKTFFQRRPFPGSDDGKLVKIATERTPQGKWVNAKTVKGMSSHVFVQYDAKVVVET